MKLFEYRPTCGDKTPHMFHNFVNMHFKNEWCGGLCDCGMRGPHGPGEHK
jgi:hypothetical protein